MKLSLGFSPCPNDTYIFESLLFEEILPEIKFDYKMEDVQTLNNWAMNGELDITKLSFAAWLQVSDEYQMLDAGAALGHGCGPLIIAKAKKNLKELEGRKIAIPGKHTTANFLLNFALPFKFEAVEMSFDEIEQAVQNESVDAGLIIHENRFTYADKGLVKLIDLGEYWEEETKCPIPLGGIAIKRSFDDELKSTISDAIAKSVHLANAKTGLSEFIKCNAQEMKVDVMRKHIDLYVNDHSISLGKSGEKAILSMAQIALDKNWIKELPQNPFVK